MKDVPDWLFKWTYLVCQYILFEESLYSETFKADYPLTVTEESLALDAKNLKDGKLQNVAITIDKVMHVLKRMNTNQPPLRTLSPAELY